MPVPLAALIPILAALAPYAGRILGRAIGGTAGKQTGEEIGQQVRDVVDDIFGTTQPDEVEKLARQDPAKAAELRVRLTELANTAQIAEIRAEVENLASARSTMVDLVRGGSALGYAPAVISTLVTIGFFGVLALLLTINRIWDERQATIISVVVGALAAGFTGVIQFWLGSSIGSKRAGDTVAAQAQQAVAALATTAQQANTAPQATTVSVQGSPPVTVRQAPPDPVATAFRGRAAMGDAPGAADRLNDEAWRVAREG